MVEEKHEQGSEQPDEYSREYTEQSFWEKLKNFSISAGQEVVEKALVLFYCLGDSRTPAWARSVIVGALGYFVMPIDAIADITPAVGYSDDLGVLALATATVALYINKEHRQKARKKLNAWFDKPEKKAPLQ